MFPQTPVYGTVAIVEEKSLFKNLLIMVLVLGCIGLGYVAWHNAQPFTCDYSRWDAESQRYECVKYIGG